MLFGNIRVEANIWVSNTAEKPTEFMIRREPTPCIRREPTPYESVFHVRSRHHEAERCEVG